MNYGATLVENPHFNTSVVRSFSSADWLFDRSSLRRWRQRMGEQKPPALLQESLAVARTAAMKP